MQAFTLGDWRVDPITRSLKHEGEPTQPSTRVGNKAMGVLQALVEAGGSVVTRKDLMDRVWANTTVGEEVLTHAIAELRRAFGDNPRAPRYIGTVQKSGYRLLAPLEVFPPAQAGQRIGEVHAAADRGGRPAIAVLPFANPSGAPEQAYFSDGITEDIITELARFPTLAVAARNSSFKYRAKPADLRSVARELDIGYVLEGSVRKVDSRVRITAQLVDSDSGRHLWAERYDRHLGEIFELQDEIVATIVATLSDQIASASLAQARRRPHGHWRAYDHYLMARHCSQLPRTVQNVSRVVDFAERAIAADPHYAAGYGMLSNAIRWLAVLTSFGDSRATEAAYARARENALKAKELSPDDARMLRALGWSYLCHREYGEAERALRRAFETNPHDGDVTMAWVTALTYLGRPEEAVALAERTIARTPHHPDYYLYDLGEARFFAGDTARAVALFEQLPDEELDECLAAVIAAFALVGSRADARRQAERYCEELRSAWKGIPGAAIAKRIAWEFQYRHVHRRAEDIALIKKGLHMAGLPA